MLRAAGTTAVRERAEIKRYNERGDEVVQRARMAHTESGSFAIPILMPVGPPTQHVADDTPFPAGPPEPFERRVVRTFSQSLHALRQLVISPDRESGPDALLAMVERGVSREFCLAVARILAEPSVTEFESRVEWATALEGPTQAQTVKIGSDAGELIERTARRMRSTPGELRLVFSGQIVGLHRGEHDSLGDIFASTVRSGRQCEIRVSLPAKDYVRAVKWHRDHRPVIVEGDVSHDAGRRLLVVNLQRCHPFGRNSAYRSRHSPLSPYVG